MYEKHAESLIKYNWWMLKIKPDEKALNDKHTHTHILTYTWNGLIVDLYPSGECYYLLNFVRKVHLQRSNRWNIKKITWLSAFKQKRITLNTHKHIHTLNK